MINADLIQLTGAALTKRAGKRRAVTVALPCRPWARKHQELLRDCFRHPHAELSLDVLMNGISLEDLLALGFLTMELDRWDPIRQRSFMELRWSHRLGDDHGVRVLVGLIDGRTEHSDATQRAATMLHELESGRGRVTR